MMRAFSIALWSTILVTSPALADSAALRTELAKTLPTLAEQGLTVSVQFIPVDRISDPDRVVSAYPNDPRIPASVTKLVTAAAALDLLGPRYTFRTRLARTGPIENGVLHGDLYIVGDGDPFLVSERLWLLANQLRLAGIDAITGRLVFDDSAWPKIEDWSSFGGSDRAYAATPSALAMNFNAVAIHITPGSAEGDPVVVRQDPFDLPYLTIENRLRTGKRGSAVRWSLDLRPAAPSARTLALADSSKRVPGTDESSSSSLPGTSSSSRLPLAEAAYPSEIARLEGTVPAGHAPFVAYRRAREPLALAGSLLHGFLRSAGVDHRGGIAFGPVPYDAVTILEFESLPLDDLVASMNRFSNNFIANQLALAIERGGSPRDSLVDRTDPLHRAGSALSKWLRETAGSADASHFADGSGLSTRNRTTAQALVTLLRYAWNDLRIHGPFLASLPGPGENGTLDRRMRRMEGATVRAKTGSLPDEGVSTLAGYVQTPAGSPVAFAILMSSRSDRWNVPAMHDLQDRWIELYAR
jgi:D-alanyl-D-alanine carboxypeptidase/D-alanyl-D-alanine-endopeptidase (penicillin-binding protein 4)